MERQVRQAFPCEVVLHNRYKADRLLVLIVELILILSQLDRHFEFRSDMPPDTGGSEIVTMIVSPRYPRGGFKQRAVELYLSLDKPAYAEAGRRLGVEAGSVAAWVKAATVSDEAFARSENAHLTSWTNTAGAALPGKQTKRQFIERSSGKKVLLLIW